MLPRALTRQLPHVILAWLLSWTVATGGQAALAKPQASPLRQRIAAALDGVSAIDTHDHLPPRDQMRELVSTPRGRGVNLCSLWQYSYFPWIHRVAPWPADGNFDAWWKQQQPNFANAKATSAYRYLLPAFADLYGVDFDTITPEQARQLNEQIFDNYRSDNWIEDVVTKRANIELMVVDPYWARLQFGRAYRFSVPLLNVTTLMRGSHPSQFGSEMDSPFAFARKRNLKTDTLADFLKVVDAIFAEAVAADCVCLKSTQAYERTLRYEKVSQQRAAAVYGKAKKEITPQEQQDFEDFMFWHVCKLSAKYELPFQIHTGQARIQGSNPMLLVDLIQANPQTKFILFHGGYPWVGETAVIAMRNRNVWIDSVWLPTLSQTVARRAYQEWLDAVPSDRIMWGADASNVEGIYGATALTRQALTDALTEKVERGELREDDALRIGRQILRENALTIFPKLRRWLWRKDGQTSGEPGASAPGVTTRVPGASEAPPQTNQSEAAASAIATRTLRGRIVDADSGTPLPGRLYIEGPEKGQWHTVRATGPRGPGVEYRKNYGTHSVEIHTALPAGEFTAELPPGIYTLTAERGKEWLPASIEVEIDNEPVQVDLKLKRFVDIQRLGWFSGETHCHRALSELPTAMLADDLNVTLPITSWTTEADTVPPPPKEPLEAKLVEIDPTHVYWPLNTEYEIFNVNRKPHMLGAVFALNQKKPLKSTVPPVGPLAAEVHDQGALLELDKHNWPWSMMIVPTMKVDLYELTNNHVWRTGFHFGRWAIQPPDYMNAERDAKGLTENGWIEFGLQNYYALLNCGFRLRPTGGTASGVHPVPLGYGRVYVHCPNGFNYDDWMRGLNAGRSFVTTGPLMDVRLSKQLPGHTFQQQDAEASYQLDGWLYSARPLKRAEVIVNGTVAANIMMQPIAFVGGGFAVRVSIPISVRGSIWLALRCFEPYEAGRSRFAHSAPWHIDVPGTPLLPKPKEVAFLVERMKTEIQRHTGVLPEAAVAEYRQALAGYDTLARNAQRAPDSEKLSPFTIGSWGNLRGMFRYAGTPPARKFVEVTRDKHVYRDPIPSEALIVDPRTRGMANIAVWLDRPNDVPLWIHPAYDSTANAPQRICVLQGRYVPHVGLQRTSQPLHILNSDTVAHLPYLDRDYVRHSQPLMRGVFQTCLFNKTLPIGCKITCDIHPWEVGYVIVKDHPYMAVTAADGSFQIKNLPAGTWRFYFWQEKAGWLPVPINGKVREKPYSPITITIRPGDNDLGTINLKPELFHSDAASKSK